MRILEGEAPDIDEEATEKYFTQHVAQPMLRTFDQDIVPRIREAFNASGNLFSVRRGLAETDALGDLAAQLSTGLGNAQLQNQQLQAQLQDSALARMLAGSQAATQVSMGPAQRILALQQAYNAPNIPSPSIAAALQFFNPSPSPFDTTFYEQDSAFQSAMNALSGGVSGSMEGYESGGWIGAIGGGIGGFLGGLSA